LLNLTRKSFRSSVDGFMLLDLIQKKTEKEVTVSINEDYIIGIIKYCFPRKFEEQKLNEYTKEVCKLAGINKMAKGKKHNIEKTVEF
jgi:hypothetical protein